MSRLKDDMPRLFRDHRSRPSRQLRATYHEIMARFHLTDGISRRVAVLAAKAWLDYAALAQEIADYSTRTNNQKRAAATLARLRRRQAGFAGAFLGGIRTLATMSSAPEKAFNLLDELAKQGGGEE